MVCKTCGNQITDEANVCPMCGTPIDKTQMQNENSYTPAIYKEIDEDGKTSKHLIKAIRKMENSAILWIIIGVFQIIFGLPTLCFGYGLGSIGIGVWNIIQSNKQKKNAKYFLNHPESIVTYYEDQLDMIVVFLFINLIFGSVIGILGSIYELSIQNYVKTHKDEILRGE